MECISIASQREALCRLASCCFCSDGCCWDADKGCLGVYEAALLSTETGTVLIGIQELHTLSKNNQSGTCRILSGIASDSALSIWIKLTSHKGLTRFLGG